MDKQPDALRLAQRQDKGPWLLRYQDCEQSAAELRRQHDEIKAIKAAVQKLHAAKGRYHTQIACADLFELCGLRAERPKKDGTNTAG